MFLGALYCAYHILQAMALQSLYVSTYVILSHVDYLFLFIFSQCIMKRSLNRWHFLSMLLILVGIFCYMCLAFAWVKGVPTVSVTLKNVAAIESLIPIVYLVTSRLALVLYGTISKRMLIQQGKKVQMADRKAREDAGDYIEEEQEELSSEHLFPDKLVNHPSLPSELALTQVDMKFDDAMFDSEFFSCSLPLTNELNGISGSLCLAPMAAIVAFVNMEGPTGYELFFESGFFVIILIVVAALQHYSYPTYAHRVIYQNASSLLYTVIKCFILCVAGVGSSMFLEDNLGGMAFKTVGAMCILSGIVFYRLAGFKNTAEAAEMQNVGALRLVFEQELGEKFKDEEIAELQLARTVLGNAPYQRIVFETALRLNKDAWLKPRGFLRCDVYQQFHPKPPGADEEDMDPEAASMTHEEKLAKMQKEIANNARSS